LSFLFIFNDKKIFIISSIFPLFIVFELISIRRGRDRMVVGFTTTCAISAYRHWSCEFKYRLWCGVLDTTLCDKVCHLLATGRLFSLDTPVSSINNTDLNDITEILSSAQ
jgi:hypothetical protein